MSKTHGWRRVTAVTVKKFTGHTYNFNSLKEAVLRIGHFIDCRCDVDFRKILRRDRLGVERTTARGHSRCTSWGNEWRFIDDDTGLTIPAWRVHQEWANLPNAKPRQAIHGRPVRFKFRHGPVTGIRASGVISESGFR